MKDEPVSAASFPGGPVEPLTLFEILMRENADSLTAFLRANVDDQGAADDLFQDTMLIAWRKIGEFDRTRPFGAWLRGIARNLLLAHFRSRAGQIFMPGEEVLDQLDRRMQQIDQQPGDRFDEKIAALRDCLERLAPPFRESIDLHYRQSKTTQWIADHLATTRDAIHKRLQRARLQLADCLERKGVLLATGARS